MSDRAAVHHAIVHRSPAAAGQSAAGGMESAAGGGGAVAGEAVFWLPALCTVHSLCQTGAAVPKREREKQILWPNSQR